VSNGSDVFLVDGCREHIGAPMQYRLRPGRLVAEAPVVEISDDEIRAEVDRALFPGVAAERKLAAFAERFKRLVWELDPTELEIVYDVPRDPTLSVARLPAAALERLSAVAREIFDADDAARVARSLVKSAEEPDAFTVLVRRRVAVESPVA
jgi:hypothetical protein